MSNIFKKIPNELKDELFENIIKKDNLKIDRIVSKGHITQKDKWYNQENDEWVIVLSGEAILEFENEDYIKLTEGDYINIPAHKKHRVAWTQPDIHTVWLAIHY